MENISCKSCGAAVSIGDGSVKFVCPLCEEVIGRCSRCRRLGKKYISACGFEGP